MWVRQGQSKGYSSILWWSQVMLRFSIKWQPSVIKFNSLFSLYVYFTLFLSLDFLYAHFVSESHFQINLPIWICPPSFDSGSLAKMRGRLLLLNLCCIFILCNYYFYLALPLSAFPDGYLEFALRLLQTFTSSS